MAQLPLTLTYPDAKAADLRDTMCLALNYPTTIPNPAYVEGGQEPVTIPNTETKAQFLTRKCQEHLATWIKNTYKAEKDRQTAIAVESDNSITIS